MSNEFSKLDDGVLENMSGGKHKEKTHDSCPDDAIEMKWNLDHFPSDKKAKKGCPTCGGKLKDQKFWFEGTKRLHNGYICESDDTHRWIYGSPI